MDTTGPLPITLLTVVVFVIVFFLWALADALRRTFANPRQKLLWLLVIVFIPLVGPIIYLIEGRTLDYRA